MVSTIGAYSSKNIMFSGTLVKLDSPTGTTLTLLFPPTKRTCLRNQLYCLHRCAIWVPYDRSSNVDHGHRSRLHVVMVCLVCVTVTSTNFRPIDLKVKSWPLVLRRWWVQGQIQKGFYFHVNGSIGIRAKNRLRDMTGFGMYTLKTSRKVVLDNPSVCLSVGPSVRLAVAFPASCHGCKG